jgi:hypothetical protein
MDDRELRKGPWTLQEADPFATLLVAGKLTMPCFT